MKDDHQRRTGAFFTPAIWVAEAHKSLDRSLGPNWKEECIVWDPSCGSGNLTKDYLFKDLILSSLEPSDIQGIKDQGYNTGAQIFQYDFLNPLEADSESFFDYATGGLPCASQLRRAAKAGKRLVFLLNPPYGSSGNAGGDKKNKTGIGANKINQSMKKADLGPCRQQLYVQFLFQCSVLAEAYGFDKNTIAVFCPPSYIQSEHYRKFRPYWYGRYGFDKGFLFCANHFKGLSPKWAVTWTIWHEGSTSDPNIVLDLKDIKEGEVISIGEKRLYHGDGRQASKWLREPIKHLKEKMDAPVFSSGLRIKDTGRGKLLKGCSAYRNDTPLVSNGSVAYFNTGPNRAGERANVITFLTSGATADGHGTSVVPEGSVGYLTANGNNLSNSGKAFLTSAASTEGNGTAVVPEGSVAYFTARGNNLQNAGRITYLTSSVSSDQGTAVLAEDGNWRRTIAVFGARKLVAGTWVNDKDEYLVPTRSEDYEQWVNDCHIYTILHNSNNCTAMRNVNYKEDSWTIRNHFFWLSRNEIESSLYPSLLEDYNLHRQESYMSLVIPSLVLSSEAQEVLGKLNDLWLRSMTKREAFAAEKPELHLCAWDAGLYQLKHLWRDHFPDEWKDLKDSFSSLSDKLRPGVYDHGFLLR